jgi:hypothetical protein
MPSHAAAKFSPKQDAAAVLLASGKSVRDVATEVDAGLRTIYDWRDDPQFAALVNLYRGRLIDEALGRLADANVKAAETLIELLGHEEASATRIRAATSILDQTIRIRENVELERRLSELEGRTPA